MAHADNYQLLITNYLIHSCKRSGRLSAVIFFACSRLHASTAPWLPENKISGTARP